MKNGIIYTLLGLISFSVLGFIYKIIVYKKCGIKNTLFFASISSLLFSIILFLFHKSALDHSAFIIGAIGGGTLYVALYFYLNSLIIGKKVISWVVFKMSLIIAVAASIFIWNEKPGLCQILGFFVMLSAIVFFGIDMKVKEQK